MANNIDELAARHAGLLRDRQELVNNVTTIKAELSARKNSLKQVMDEAKEAGLDPNNLAADIRRDSEVVKVKLDAFESEIRDAKKLVDPMLKEMNNG